MDGWSYVSHIFCECMGKVLQAKDIIHTCVYPPSRQYTTKAVGEGFAVSSANHQAIPVDVWDMIQGTSGDGWIATLFTCFVDVWERSHKPGM